MKLRATPKVTFEIIFLSIGLFQLSMYIGTLHQINAINTHVAEHLLDYSLPVLEY